MKIIKLLFISSIIAGIFFTQILYAEKKNEKKYPEKTTSTTEFEEIHLQPEEITPEVIELKPNEVQFQEITPQAEELPEENFQVYVPQLKEITPEEFAKERQKAIKFEELKPQAPELAVTPEKKPEKPKYGKLEKELPAAPVVPQEVEEFKPKPPSPEEVKPKVVVSEAPPPPPEEKPQAPIIPLAPPPTPETPQIPREVAPAQAPKIKIAMNEEYKKQLSQLARQLALLKERVIEAKTRIIAYGERLTKGFTSGTKVTIDCINNLGNDFRITRMAVFLDGHQVFLNEYSLEENPTGEIKIYRGSILPGRHKVDIKLTLRGDKGIFDFSFSAVLKVEAGQFFTATEGKIEHIKIKLIDRGGWFTSIEKRPEVKFQITEEESY